MLNINFQSSFSGVSGKKVRPLYQYVGHWTPHRQVKGAILKDQEKKSKYLIIRHMPYQNVGCCMYFV